MKQRQHNITWFAGGRAGSDVQAIRRMPNGTFEAASEPRILASGGYAV
jgi:gamma-glutamyltranspeptidase/glutathione hydrolase